MVKSRTNAPALASARGPPIAEMRKPRPPLFRLGCPASALPGTRPRAGRDGEWRFRLLEQTSAWMAMAPMDPAWYALRLGNLPRPHPSAGVFLVRSRREAIAPAQAMNVGRQRPGMQTPRHQGRRLRRRRRPETAPPPGNRLAPARARPRLRRPCGQFSRSADRNLFVKICLELKHNL